MKESKYGRYINTAKSDKFKFEETTPFTEPLVDIEDIEQITTSTINAKIIRVTSVTNNLMCVSCHKTVTPKAGSKIGNCNNCKMMQRISSCGSSWTVREKAPFISTQQSMCAKAPEYRVILSKSEYN